MANTYAKIYIHIVFAVRNRQSLLSKQLREPLNKYITGVVTNCGQKMLQVNNHKDHIHLLVGCRTSVRLDDLVKEVKEHSNRWINTNRFVKGKFQWQEGYGAFSVASWNYDVIYNYIKNQEEHHNKKTFIQEYEELLTQEGIEYDRKYIFYDPNLVE
jgi:putative transposase